MILTFLIGYLTGVAMFIRSFFVKTDREFFLDSVAILTLSYTLTKGIPYLLS